MPVSSTTFTQRLGRIEENRSLPNGGQDVPELPKPKKRRKIHPFAALLALPIGVALGAGAVLAAGVINVALVGDGLTEGTVLPPRMTLLGYIFGFAMVFFTDKVLNFGSFGSSATLVGFVGMWRGEHLLLERFPELWITIYTADYLPAALVALAETPT
ncbi:MAG: hypothetical protein AAFN09_09900 [Pseudomonadota bacterium]